MRLRSFCILALLATPLFIHAQRRKSKTPAIPVTEQVQQALAVYDFDRADELLETEMAALTRKHKSTAHLDSLMRRVRQGQAKLHATERIVVIDSVVCPREQMLEQIRLSRESGRLDKYASSFLVSDRSEAVVYENELSNKRYFALPQTMHLAFADKIGDQWSDPVELKGLNIDDGQQNYPFLLSDGLTLYYGAKGPESFGGYDIFVSRADGEDGTFLAPENVGFPYNSPANDYLLAIDELNRLGWLATDRYQSEGNVCIYVFIPNETREVYGDDVTAEQLRAFARLSSIRDTWNNAASEKETQGALQRLADVRSGKALGEKLNQHDFHFVIDDHHTYTALDDFRSPEARQLMQQWLSLNNTHATDAVMLERLRDNYATASPAQRQQLAPTIRRMEAVFYPRQRQLDHLAKTIRNKEIAVF
ncbi:MAG: hypothetical protein K6A32_01710 [Bacteroidales bacterium]|nr:hypothetical protein [Bacteroidales bacterium]